MATGRHLVHSSMVDEYVATLVEKAKNLTVGDPNDAANALGPIIDAGQRDRVHGIVMAAVDAGGSLAAGGEYTDLFYRPIVLTGLTADNPAFTQEIFGPVAPVITYDTVEEAVDLINASEYGLSVSILTSNAYQGYLLADQIDSGAIHINDQTVDDEAVAPFGGYKASGVGGRFGGPHAVLDAFTETQWITIQQSIERYPF